MQYIRSELKAFVAKQTLMEGINQSRVPSVRIFKSSRTTQPLNTAYEPSLFVIVQGAKIVLLGNRTIEYDENRYLISSAFLPVSGKITKASEDQPFLSFQIIFSLEKLFEAMDDFSFQPKKVAKTTLAMQASDVTDVLLDPVLRLVKLAESPEDIPVLESMYLKEILYRLLMTENNLALQQLVFVEGNGYKISKAIAYINERLYERLNVEELAAQVNMSVSTFHKHFKIMTHVSPLQYIKMQRLQNAKKLMVSENMDVSGASFQVGYQSLSQFSREYSSYFGLSPSEDVKQFRENWSSAF